VFQDGRNKIMTFNKIKFYPLNTRTPFYNLNIKNF
jgi:hypothetical protein